MSLLLAGSACQSGRWHYGRVSEHLPVLSRGSCGGLDQLALAETASLLEHRVRLRVSEHTQVVESDRASALLKIHGRSARFHVRVDELGQRAPHDLAQAVRRHVSRSATITEVRSEVGDPLVLALYDDVHDEWWPGPREHRRSVDGPLAFPTIVLVDAYLPTIDRTLIRVSIGVPPELAEAAGCQQVATAFARMISVGERAFSEGLPAGEHWLGASLAVRLPPDHTVRAFLNQSFARYEIAPIGELGDPEALLLVLVEPAEVPDRTGETVRAPTLGREREWREWRTAGRTYREALVESGREAILVALVAERAEDLERLAATAATLTRGEQPRRPLDCDAIAAPALASRLADQPSAELTTLLGAERFAITDRGWGIDVPSELRAFRRLVERPDPLPELRHLAEHGTSAGRLYGLAGISARAPELLDQVLCAVRDALDEEVVVVEQCGPATRAVGPLLDSTADDAIRGERFWPEDAWWEGTADIRGGALAYRLRRPEPGQDPMLLAGDGFVPPLLADAPAPTPLRSGAPSAPRRIAPSDQGGLCWTRDDGRVACAGQAGPAYRGEGTGQPPAPRPTPNVVLAPDMVRHPADLVVAGQHVCVLDVEGRRACTGQIDFHRALRAERCGAPVPREVSYRVFDDGPWRELITIRSELCGIRAQDGALYCFYRSPFGLAAPLVAGDREPGIFGAYRIPIDGQVRGAAAGSLRDPFAYTEDGVLWEWTPESLPRPTHRFEGRIAQVAKFEYVDFVRLEDGRFYTRGARAPDYPYAPGSMRAPREWVDATSLQVAEVQVSPFGSHACFRFTNGQVGCWNACAAVLGRPPCTRSMESGTLYRLEPLFGATRLLVSENLACGQLASGAVRCLGRGLDWIYGPDAPASFLIDLDALAREAREATLD